MACSLHAQPSAAPASVKGVITDPSGANIPNSVVVLTGPTGERQQKTTGAQGQYTFESVKPGKYAITITAKGFQTFARTDLDATGTVVLDAQLAIVTEAQVVNVQDCAHNVTVDPGSNGGALVLTNRKIDLQLRFAF